MKPQVPSLNLSSSQAIGLVAWFPLMEGGGTKAYNRALFSANEGSFTGSPSPVVTPLNTFGLHVSSGNYVMTPKNASTLVSATDWSVSVWTKPTTTGGSGGSFNGSSIFANTGGYFGLMQGVNSAINQLYAFNYTTVSTYVGITYTVGVWYHLVAVHTGGNLYLYVNGVLNGSTSSGNTGSLASVMRIGNGGSSGPYVGDVVDARLYNRGLNAAEVADIYLAPYKLWNNIKNKKGNIITSAPAGIVYRRSLSLIGTRTGSRQAA